MKRRKKEKEKKFMRKGSRMSCKERAKKAKEK